MQPEILGLHHVTAIATAPQANADFYREVLGLRLVKRTVNFDDPGTYHLYYGDELGRPGTILTFFPWPLARRGRRGAGQATAVAFSAVEGSLGWWRDRLSGRGVDHDGPFERFGEEVLTLTDPDGLGLELITQRDAAARRPWAMGPIPTDRALRGFHSVTVTVRRHQATVELLTRVLGFRSAGERENRFRFETGSLGGFGTKLDLVSVPRAGIGHVSAGSIHHVAWRAEGAPEQLALRERLLRHGHDPTPVLDRKYFESVYFREPGGVLFEIATDPPGFTVDEPAETLGEALELPAWLEPDRFRIEAALPPLRTPPTGGGHAVM